jgi:hypothetical protein
MQNSLIFYREVDTGLKIYSEIYDNSSKIQKFMENLQKSITILENLWKIGRQLLIYKLTTRPATAKLDTAVKKKFVYKWA